MLWRNGNIASNVKKTSLHFAFPCRASNCSEWKHSLNWIHIFQNLSQRLFDIFSVARLGGLHSEALYPIVGTMRCKNIEFPLSEKTWDILRCTFLNIKLKLTAITKLLERSVDSSKSVDEASLNIKLKNYIRSEPPKL